MANTNMNAQLIEVAQRIKTLREILEISEEEMAQNTNVSIGEYQKYELGKGF